MKRGQVAIFVIVAIVLVGFVLALFFLPQARVLLPGGESQDPGSFMRSCLKSKLEEGLGKLAEQGGSLNPSPSTSYQGKEIQYLCYTDENYLPCIVQKPLLVKSFQQELENYVRSDVKRCVSDLKSDYESRGYTVSSSSGDFNVSIIPGRISLELEEGITISKETTQTFKSFSATQSSELYNLLLIATSIVDFESKLGDSETTLYIQYYPELKIEKMRRDADKIYTLTNVNSGESFTFATRSLVWPAGFGGELS
ncbi:MAG: hypothetical protein AABW79_04620 [Nanoarchaeota archaeon]